MTQLPHVLKRIRLNLARSKEFPSGSDRHAYEFVAPLDADGRIDPELWRRYREHCGVRRYWEGENDEFGRLVHRPGAPNPRAGYSTMTRRRRTTTRPAIASATTCFETANTSRSAAKTARCIPFGWCRSSRGPDACMPLVCPTPHACGMVWT